MIALTFTNCQQEDDTIVKQNKHEQKSSLSINKIEQFSLKEKPNLNKKINSLKNTFTKGNTSNNHSKLWYSNAYDFYIETDMVTYIENGTYHSYTFPIYGTENSTLLRNLLLSLQTDGTYSAFLVTYNLSEQQLADLSNDQNITGDYDFSFTSLDTLDTSNIFNKVTYNETTGCWEDVTTFHSNQDGSWVFNNDCQHADELGFCTEWTIVSQLPCSGSGGGSGGTTNPGNDNSPNTNTGIGSNGSNTQNPDSTTPTYCKNCPEIEDLEEDCPQPDDATLAQLESIFGVGNYEINCDIDPATSLNFNTTVELENFLTDLQNVEYSTITDETDDIQVGTHITRFKANLRDVELVVVDLEIDIKSTLDNLYTSQNEFSILEVFSIISYDGPVLTFGWTQGPYIYSEEYPNIKINLTGFAQFNYTIGGVGVSGVSRIDAQVILNKFSGTGSSINVIEY